MFVTDTLSEQPVMEKYIFKVLLLEYFHFLLLHTSSAPLL